MTRRVLVVDDDPLILELLSAVLCGDEFEVSTAAGGAEAIAAVRRSGPDVVVCDVMMPEVDGLEVCRRLRSSPGTVGLPVILLSARQGPEDRRAGEAAGCDVYLAKPFRPLQLIDAIRELADRRSPVEV
jgi:two-component system, cell cycle response regulator